MKLVIIGYGGHGKGTVAKYLVKHTTLRCEESTSEAACRLFLFDQLVADGHEYATWRDCWHDRHNGRAEWARRIWEYNVTVPSGLRLYEDMMTDNDIFEGVRKSAELQSLKDSSMIDLVIWVDALQRLPREDWASCQVSKVDAAVVINNNGTEEELPAILDDFITQHLVGLKNG